MTPADFDRLAREGYNRIPVVEEVLADLDTPLSVYLKLARGPYSYLLESAQGGEKWGRYSIIGLPCRTILTVRDHTITVATDGVVEEELQVQDCPEITGLFFSKQQDDILYATESTTNSFLKIQVTSTQS